MKAGAKTLSYKLFHKSYFGLFGCLLLLLSSLSLADSPLSLWRINHGQAQVYLFGSIHLIPESFYPLPTEVDAAFDDSDLAVFELDLAKSTPQETNTLLMKLGLFQAPQQLSKVLPPATHKLLVDYLAKNGRSIQSVDGIKPWLLGLQIALAEFTKLGFSGNLGLDNHYQQKARLANKPILELETVQKQLNMLAADDMATQVRALQVELENLDGVKVFANSLLDAWRAGDAQGMYELASESSRDDPLMQAQLTRLLDHRNINMTNQIKGFLATDQTYFVVVGALHMGGQKGLLKLLEKDFTIEQVYHSADQYHIESSCEDPC